MTHPENLLLNVLADKRRHSRELAFRRIIKARGSSITVEISFFVVPKLNFKANQCSVMINWFKRDGTEPPITADLTVEEQKSIAQNVFKYPFHTQSVERCVKLVTEAASTVCGSHKRDGFIKNTMASRAIMISYEHKANYKMMYFTA
ncbi:hypothetical protein AVEN_66125-1 [Araneus ventricosus]|uniref:Uncharacterized protein n=1 Tax=Araneus ventricosus TaxID=182803 RepID=A0A4Y2HHR5_ARAVE|nr:hypothetical protein AVEN_66125-1 [Araneus ventricosus]